MDNPGIEKANGDKKADDPSTSINVANGRIDDLGIGIADIDANRRAKNPSIGTTDADKIKNSDTNVDRGVDK